jgi:TPP-dependent 2-oxoacid decarboxylase
MTTQNLNDKLVRKEIVIDADAEQAAIDHIYRRFDDAFSEELKDNVVVIADVSIGRHHCRNEVEEFLAVTKLPVYGTPLGKTVVNETSERYGGVSARWLTPNDYITRFIGLYRTTEFSCGSAESRISETCSFHRPSHHRL